MATNQTITAGYKQTEVGVMPDDWKIVRFADFLDFKNGVNAEKKDYGSGIKFINVLEPITFSHLCSADIPGMVNLTNAAINMYAVKKGDLVFNRTSETDEELGLAAVYTDDDPVVFGGFVIRGRPTNALFDPTYTGFAFRAPFIRSQIIARGQGAVRANIGQSDLKKVYVPLPPISEQISISSVLTNVNDLIQNLEQLISKKISIKQGAMQELLTGKRRLPGYSGKWVTKYLGDIAVVTMGQSPQSIFYNKNGVGLPLIQGNADIEDRKTIIRTYTSSIPKKGKKGDTIMSVRAPVGEIAKAAFDCCLGRGVCAISYTNEFLYHYLVFFEKSWTKHSKGSTFDSVNSKEVNELKIQLPMDEGEQIKIAESLSSMDREIETLQMKLEKLKHIKQGMMQVLLTGKIRLPKT